MIIRDKKFYKTIMTIAIPIALQNFISFMVNLLDTLMLGQLGETILSGANLAGQMFFIMTVTIMGISEGSNVLISQFYGKKDIKSIHKIYAISYRLTFLVGVIAFLIAYFLPEFFMSIYSNDADVIIEGAKYLKIMSISYIPYALTAMTITTLRAVHSTKISVYVYGTSFFINAIINYTLIFGKFGFKSYGIQGAGIGTVVSRTIEFVLIIIYMAKYDEKIRLKLSHLKKIDIESFKNYAKNSSPIIINDMLWVVGTTAISIIYGRMGKEMVSANVICTVMYQLVSIFLFGIASSSLVMIGNVIGEGKISKAYEYAKTFMVIALFIGVLSTTVVYFTKDLVIGFYNITPETVEIATELMKANSIILFFQTQAIIYGLGILRGGGDSKTVLITEVVLVYLLSVPLGIFSAFYLKLSPFWVFFLTRIDVPIKNLVFGIRILCSKWARDITIGENNNE